MPSLPLCITGFEQVAKVERESVVYGVIRDLIWTADAGGARRLAHNQEVLATLPEDEGGPLLWRAMFSSQAARDLGCAYQSSLIHFGLTCRGLEYEWASWMHAFETLLRRLYWVQAKVHLETEGAAQHVFIWEPEQDFHGPDMPMALRCAWERID